jgi:hypothetical protein
LRHWLTWQRDHIASGDKEAFTAGYGFSSEGTPPQHPYTPHFAQKLILPRVITR